jgi:acyl-CoA thioester hydrolase
VTEYAFETEVEVRFSDVDVAGHVNNAVYGTYVEQARIEYLRELFGDGLAEERTVLARFAIDYERPVDLGTETVTVAVRTTSVGSTSLAMEYEIRTGDGVAATADAVLVTVDGDEPTPVPETWRTAIEAFEGL